jgi:hypothetical protein
MGKFKVTFIHTVEVERSCIIEAENLKEANSIVKDNDFNPFDYDNVEDIGEQGLELEISKIEEVV